MMRPDRLPVVLVLVAGLAPIAAAQTAPAACADSAWIWSAPEPVAWDHPAGMMLTEATAEAMGTSQLVAGNVFPVAPEGRMLPRPARLLRIPGDPVPLPDGDFSFVAPRAIPDARGRIHLLWTEPDSTTGETHRFMIERGAVLHAVRAPGGWSRPKPLPVRRADLTGTGRIAAFDARGRLHLVLPLAWWRGDVRMTHLRRDGGKWRVSPLPTMAGYVSLLLGDGDTVRIAFTAGRLRRDGGQDGNSVWVVTSPDGGETWGKRRLLQQSGETAATRVHLFRGDGDTLHLLWAQNLRGGLDAEVLRHRWSADGGASWRATPDSPLGSTLRLLPPPIRHGGEILALTETMVGADDGRLELHRWRGDRVRVDRLPFGESGFDPVLTTAGDDGVRISYVHREGQIRTVTGRPACPGSHAQPGGRANSIREGDP